LYILCKYFDVLECLNLITSHRDPFAHHINITVTTPAGRITNDGGFQRAKGERLVLQIFKNRCHSMIGHIIRHNEFVVNILEGAISGKKAVGRPRLQ
jgi:hypothetical protein